MKPFIDLTTWRALWPDARPTPLVELSTLARLAGVSRVFVKSEGERPLGSFKALGGMMAAIRALADATGIDDVSELCASDVCRTLPGLICASEGNHGLSVAAAAQKVHTRAVIYLGRGVSDVRVARIQATGAEVVRIDGTYDDAVLAAEAAAARGDGILISDTATDADSPVVDDVMRGYGLLAQELSQQFREPEREPPTHLFVQAGVGGLAAAMVHGLQDVLRQPKQFLIVEPAAAACVAPALQAGRPVVIDGSLQTSATMLACGVASAPAVRILQRYNVSSVLVDEDRLLSSAADMLDAGGPATTASGATGLAGLLQVAGNKELRKLHTLDAHSVVLLLATERALTSA